MGEFLDRSRLVLRAVAEAGKAHHARPDITRIEPFKGYLRDGELDTSALDKRDGGVTRREALLRFLVLSSVVDQGPDITGVQRMVAEVTNDLYQREVRIFHKPLSFFESLRISLDRIVTVHDLVKKDRAEEWASQNNANAASYNLFEKGSTQVLGYGVFRWGAPLGLAYLTEQDEADAGVEEPGVKSLATRLRAYNSTEEMTKELKSDRTRGLGKAIGDKAAHLFGKWIVHSYPLLRDPTDPAWGLWSFEVPFDSNAGRVLWRTGLLPLWGTTEDFNRTEALTAGKGKKEKIHLQVTNLRGIDSRAAHAEPALVEANASLCVKHLRTHSRGPSKIELQRIPSAVSLIEGDYTPGEIDDGLIYIGTTFCLNHDKPKCGECPLNKVCAAANGKPGLITAVST